MLAGAGALLRWGPRTLDLDLLDYHGLVRRRPRRPVLPHPGIAERIFVLAPIAEIAPGWRHPVTRLTAAACCGGSIRMAKARSFKLTLTRLRPCSAPVA